ncbi:hypothetical protein, partial [Pseudomonas sp. HY2-MNA-CIBAN-0224]|uniref:hypothetical protein n=1 Tax=Pseudomonas sp. HY2-MNA-CIBAN-0224 TaxID=3140471 RepID=UPI0033298130
KSAAIGNPFFMLILRQLGVMDIIHAVIGSNAIYCLYLQGMNAMNQKTALFVVINTLKRTDSS